MSNENNSSGLSRRDFIKLIGLLPGVVLESCVVRKIIGDVSTPFTPSSPWEPTKREDVSTKTPGVPTQEASPTPTPEKPLSAAEILEKIDATQVPVIEYHYEGFAEAGVVESQELFQAQMDFLQHGGMKTITDTELADFLEGKARLPSNSVGLRIDQGVAHFDEFAQTITDIKNRGLHAIVFLVAGEPWSEDRWDKIAGWIRDGTISVGSHSVTHPDFAKLSIAQAMYEAVTSKRLIETNLAKRGIATNVIGFAFPSDSPSQNIDFLKQAGYKFALAGNLFGVTKNAARPNQFLLASLYPYAAKTTMDVIQANARNNPLAIPLVGDGYAFDQLLQYNTTPVTVQVVEEVTKQPYPELSFGRGKYLPVTPEQKSHLVPPAGIIIHTDDQSGTGFYNWTTDYTHNALVEKGFNVHFASGLDGITQMLPMYSNLITPCSGAVGFSKYISIEQTGRDFNKVLDPNIDPNLKHAIEQITATTIDLVTTLMKQYKLSFRDVLGHYEASAKGKTDPGELYMNEYFRPRLLLALQC